MLVVIDESGCTGFKQGSSTHFIIGMVVFDRLSDAEDTANVIKKLKKDNGFNREFRFSSSNNRIRDRFFEVIRNARFSVRLFVIEKKLIRSNPLKSNGELFVNYCLKNLMKDASHRIKDAVIKIDGKGSRFFRKGCESYLRKEIPFGTIKNLKFCDSKNDVLIQLADMIVSAYSRPYNNPEKQDAFKWRNMIESRIENTWNFK